MESSPEVILAVDPGLSGAVCRLEGNRIEVLRDFRVLSDIARAIQKLSYGTTRAIIEAVHAFSGQGLVSTFSFGRAAGVADGALALSLPRVPVETVDPRLWQKFFRVRYGIPPEQEFCSRSLANKMFPDYAPLFKRVKDHNTADAVLLAVYCRENHCSLGNLSK